METGQAGWLEYHSLDTSFFFLSSVTALLGHHGWTLSIDTELCHGHMVVPQGPSIGLSDCPACTSQIGILAYSK